MKKSVFLLLLLLFSACSPSGNGTRQADGERGNWTLEGFVKADSINPIMAPSGTSTFLCPVSEKEVKWEARNVLNPSAIVRDGKVWLIYRAQDNEMTSRIGLAVSDDGFHFKRYPEPVFYPSRDSMMKYEWKGGVEDPRVIEGPDGLYVMTYTSYDGKTARLCLATSHDLVTWTKHGPVLGEGKYRDTWSKSGAIVTKMEGGKPVAAMVQGKYWMYFGDTDLFVATSDDLIKWEVAENKESGRMIPVMNPRPGYFDSRLVEPGPYALVREKGILLIYNGSNASNYNDPDLPAFTYSAGEALFDLNAPYKLTDRLEKPFIFPDKPYEKTGEVNEVCFVEGLVWFRNQWFLYYGTADSRIAVAVSKGDQ